MKRYLFIVWLAVLAFALDASACTTMLVTKGASKDGSVFVAHSDDGEMGDPRMVYVPAKDYEPGTLRPVYFDANSVGERPAFHGESIHRYVGKSRSEAYDEPNLPQSLPLGFIPQVEHTYAYFDGGYGIMNEHQLMFGECTDGAKVQAEPVPGKLIFYSAELSRVALDRCTTAREAVELIGHLIETYGYYGTGETLPVGDPNEGWVIEMAPSPEGTGGLWVAKKVPDGEVFVAANEFRIREVDPDDPDMLFSSNLHAVAEAAGWWKPEDGKLDWLRTVSEGEYSHPYYSLRRVWRLMDRLSPSSNFSPWVEDGFTKAYPFSVKPDEKVDVRGVMSLYRDYYQGTEFDQSKGLTAGPFGCPYRYPGPMDAGNDTGDPHAKLKGAWERTISIYRCDYSYVCQGRSRLPDPIGGVCWFGPNEPLSTCYVPFYAGVTNISKAYYTCDTERFDLDSAWWVFNFVANWAGLKFCYIIEDIQQKQSEFETALVDGIQHMDGQAAEIYKENPEKARQLLTTYCETQADQIVKDWWSFAGLLIAKYSDGYVNEPGKMAQEVGYPKAWYDLCEWTNGPTSYAPPVQAVPGM
ncbi:MAG: C69 family dipeptidase [Kiritimatiellae bacterium]|nr:C69 family dipeptidase [Kiritimatiellia bacterium]